MTCGEPRFSRLDALRDFFRVIAHFRG